MDALYPRDSGAGLAGATITTSLSLRLSGLHSSRYDWLFCSCPVFERNYLASSSLTVLLLSLFLFLFFLYTHPPLLHFRSFRQPPLGFSGPFEKCPESSPSSYSVLDPNHAFVPPATLAFRTDCGHTGCQARTTLLPFQHSTASRRLRHHCCGKPTARVIGTAYPYLPPTPNPVTFHILRHDRSAVSGCGLFICCCSSASHRSNQQHSICHNHKLRWRDRLPSWSVKHGDSCYTALLTTLTDDRRPSIYTGNFGDCKGSSAVNVTRFDAAYYRDNMTVLFHLEGNTAIANESLMRKLASWFLSQSIHLTRPVYIGVYAYGQGRFDLTFNPCNANIAR